MARSHRRAPRPRDLSLHVPLTSRILTVPSSQSRCRPPCAKITGDGATPMHPERPTVSTHLESPRRHLRTPAHTLRSAPTDWRRHAFCRLARRRTSQERPTTIIHSTMAFPPHRLREPPKIPLTGCCPSGADTRSTCAAGPNGHVRATNRTCMRNESPFALIGTYECPPSNSPEL